MATADRVETADDPVLVDRARRGDAEAFCRLATSVEVRLYRQALALVGDAAAAEDLVAETLIGAWQGMARFEGGCRWTTWLHAILLNRFHRLLRRNRCRPRLSVDLGEGDRGPAAGTLEGLVDERPTGLDGLSDAECQELLRTALAELPEEHREVLSLRFFEDASLAEIAAALSVPVGTVKSRLHHGLGKLREKAALVNLWRERRNP